MQSSSSWRASASSRAQKCRPANAASVRGSSASAVLPPVFLQQPLKGMAQVPLAEVDGGLRRRITRCPATSASAHKTCHTDTQFARHLATGLMR